MAQLRTSYLLYIAESELEPVRHMSWTVSGSANKPESAERTRLHASVYYTSPNSMLKVSGLYITPLPSQLIFLIVHAHGKFLHRGLGTSEIILTKAIYGPFLMSEIWNMGYLDRVIGDPQRPHRRCKIKFLAKCYLHFTL